MDIVIVESPAKAKTINKYLGNDYKVIASNGHVRDLPERDGSVDTQNNFDMTWQVQPTSNKLLNEMASYVKRANRIVLATDPDREGEAISWHVIEAMKTKKALKDQKIDRVVFNAITRKSVLEAMSNPRAIDKRLVEAYMARRALDYLVGFNLSPVLWRKLPGARSAGRVQSVSLRLICEREIEIERFKTQEYWTIEVDFETKDEKILPARLTHIKGEKLDKFSLGNEESARQAETMIKAGQFYVAKIESKPTRRNPSPPFTTSTLQQEAARRLGFNAKRTMQVAQKLYEGIAIDGETTGLITYMRTDGVDIAPEAMADVRNVIKDDFGEEYLPPSPHRYKAKSANAQEAHEAVRPTEFARRPEHIAKLLNEDQAKLYSLIWKRAMASQMATAKLQRTSIDIKDKQDNTQLRASGSVVTFQGFLVLYEERQDDRQEPKTNIKQGLTRQQLARQQKSVRQKDSIRQKDSTKQQKSKKQTDETILPKVSEQDELLTNKILCEQHFTDPPPRYSEASLVKKMEELGIGRPSTYANILSVLRDRDYVYMDKNRFHPEDKGRLVISFLESFFQQYVEYDFTAALEEELDKISRGDILYREVLSSFWKDFSTIVDSVLEIRNADILEKLNQVLGAHLFNRNVDESKTTDESEAIDESEAKNQRQCPKCNEGELSLKTGRYGAFIGCTNYPDCNFTRAFGQTNKTTIEREIGKDEASGEMLYIKDGRFGAYIQLGNSSTQKQAKKPKRCTIPKDMKPETIDLVTAQKLISLPRLVGKHPETGEDIIASLGRYGPYLRHQKQSASLKNSADLFDIDIAPALKLLAEKKSTRKRTYGVIKEIGLHPENDKAVNLMNGRYGIYIKCDNVNVTLPKDETPDDITLERALELIATKATKKGRKKRRASKKKPVKKPRKAG